MKKIIEEKKIKIPKYIFYILGVVLILIFLCSLFFTYGDSIKHYLFTNYSDTFMDFFNSMYDTIGRRPYEKGVIYPPICYVMYYIFLRMIPIEQMNFGSPAFKTFQAPMLALALYEFVSIGMFIFCMFKMKKGSSREKILFLIITLMSIPFLFTFERGNIIFVALIFLMLFIYFKDSNNKFLREFALFSLAMSAAIKIYPAIFGLVLIKEKRWGEIVRVIIYGIVLFVVPFIFFGGFSEILTFIHNLTHTTDEFSVTHVINRMNFSAAIEELSYAFNFENYQFISKILILFIFVISCINSLLSKVNWKTYALLSCLIVGIPGISFTYTVIFLIIPLIYFLDSKDKKKFVDYMYLLLFILIMFPCPLSLLEHGSYSYFYNNATLNTKIMSISIIALSILLNIDVFITNIENRIKKSNNIDKKLQKNI